MSSSDDSYWHGQDFIKDLVDQIPAAIFWKNKESVFLGCNQYFADLAALPSPQYIIGKSDFDLPWKDSEAPAYVADDQRIMTSRQPELGIEEPQTLANGEKLVLLTSKIPLFAKNGDVIGILGIFHDITARKKMEVSLQEAKAKAELSSRAKTEFIANMSHDIRTPLSGVVGMSQLLANTLENPEHQQYARWINESGEQLLSLLNGILDIVSATNKSELDLSIEPFDLYTCIHNIVQLEKPTAKLKSIELRVSLADSVPRYLIADRTKLHRVLLNLVSNAIKFTKHGFVAIEIELLEQIDDQVRLGFRIIDTGIGISKEMQLKVFDRFYRANPSYKGVYSGHGVGLHLAKSFVELLGGELSLESELDVGSTFSFSVNATVGSSRLNNRAEDNLSYTEWLAATSQAMEQSIATNVSQVDTYEGMPHLLIVEDNVIALRIAELIAKQAGCSFVSAANGEDALVLAKSTHFDLILTDIGLPGISGNEIAQSIREWENQYELPPIPIVGLTAHTQAQAKDECLESGMDEVLSKPINLQKMQAILTQFIYNKQNDDTVRENKLRGDLPASDTQLFELDSFSLLDVDHAVQRMGNKDVLFEMLQLMVTEEIPRDEITLREAHAANDWDTIEKLAHKMKGGAVYCGTFKMQYACQYLERYRKAGYSELLEKLYEQLLVVLQETKHAVHEALFPVS